MTDYTTDLKTWGDDGVEYPDGYNYSDERPVDAFDDYKTYHIIEEIKRLFTLLENVDQDSLGEHGNEAHHQNYVTGVDLEEYYHSQDTQYDNEKIGLGQDMEIGQVGNNGVPLINVADGTFLRESSYTPISDVTGMDITKFDSPGSNSGDVLVSNGSDVYWTDESNVGGSTSSYSDSDARDAVTDTTLYNQIFFDGFDGDANGWYSNDPGKGIKFEDGTTGEDIILGLGELGGGLSPTFGIFNPTSGETMEFQSGSGKLLISGSLTENASL
jgi:hypothetical protein